MRWVIAYDSSCDKRRRKMAVLLEGYGVRVQDSVFECELNSTRIAQLKIRLKRLINPTLDSVRLYPLSRQNCEKVVNMGMPAAAPDIDDVVI